MMDGIFDRGLNAASNVLGLIRSANSGMCSGEPRGIRYPGVPSVESTLATLALDADEQMTEEQWDAACQLLGGDVKPIMNMEQITRYLGQGVVNIREGFMTIQPGSPIHEAMKEWCRLVESGVVGSLIAEAGKLPNQAVAAVNR